MMTPEFLQRSCLSYDQVKMTFWDDNKKMHKTCLFTDAWRWFTNTYPGADVPQFVDILVLMVKTGHYFPNQQWVLKPQGIESVDKAQSFWRLMFHPETCTRRDIITIFFVDMKTSLYRDQASESMATVISRMGPEPTFAELEESCDLDADRRTRTNMVAENDGEFVDDLEPAGFAYGTPEMPRQARFRRPPLSNFARRMFNVRSDLNDAGISRLEHFDNASDIIDDDADSYSIISFSTADGQEEQDHYIDRRPIDDDFALPVYAAQQAQRMADNTDSDDDDDDDDDDDEDDEDDEATASPFILDQAVEDDGRN